MEKFPTTIDHLECFNKPTESEKEQLFDFSRALSGGDVLKLKIFNWIETKKF